MTRKKQTPTKAASVVDAVRAQSAQAAELARISGQERLADPRLNPATRAQHDALRDEQQRRALDAAHQRAMRRHRVADAAAADAEETLSALALARQTSSPARRVLALHQGKRVYLRVSLAASVVLAAGSALGVEAAARHLDAPVGTGWIAEVGLTGLATAAIAYRAHLAENGGHLGSVREHWQARVLWALMTVPLLVSVIANVSTGNVLGAACSIGAAAFALLSATVADRSSAAMTANAKQVDTVAEKELRATAMGENVFAAPAPATTMVPPAAGAALELEYAGPVVEDDGQEHAEEHVGRDLEAPAAPVIDRQALVEAVQAAALEALSPRPAQGDDPEDGDDGDGVAEEIAAEVAQGVAELERWLQRPDEDPPGGPGPVEPPTADDGDQGAALVPADAPEDEGTDTSSGAPADTSPDRSLDTSAGPGGHIDADRPRPASEVAGTDRGAGRVTAAARARRDAGLRTRYQVATVLLRLPHTSNAALAEALKLSAKTVKRHRNALREAGWDRLTDAERAEWVAALGEQIGETR